MRRTWWIGALGLAVGVNVLLATDQPASASKGFKGVTEIACTHCHTNRNERLMSNKDLTACGKKSQEFLRGKGYPTKEPRKPSDYQKIRGFECGH